MIEFKVKYLYYIGLASIFITLFFFNENRVEVPTYTTLITILFLSFGFIHQMWIALKMGGRGCITNLQKNEGGHSCYHPDDIKIAYSKADKPSFMVMAEGGFVNGGFEWPGSERFLVFPPEHAEETDSGIIIHTKFRRINLEQLPDYIQSELMQLKMFDSKKVALKKNLYFGATAERFGTFTEENEQIVSKFLDQSSQINYYKRMVQDITIHQSPPQWTRKEEEE